jgi:hypothetical protein
MLGVVEQRTILTGAIAPQARQLESELIGQKADRFKRVMNRPEKEEQV